MNRFERQQILPEMGKEGQDRLQQSSILIIGAGGLGCPAISYLAAAGVGRLGIVDGDKVSTSNLNRQILFGQANLGQNKALVAAEHIRHQYPDLEVEVHPLFLDNHNAVQLLGDYDLIIDGSDNIGTRYLLGDACFLLGRPLVYGAIYQYEGQLTVFENKSDSITYRDVYPVMPAPDEIPSCESAGVIGVLPGIIGTMQAAEAIKYICKIGTPLIGQLLYYNLKDHSTRLLNLSHHPQAEQNRPVDLTEILNRNYQLNCQSTLEMDWASAFKLADHYPSLFIDLRHPQPGQPKVPDTYTCMNANDLNGQLDQLDKYRYLFVFCYHGISSRPVTQSLRQNYNHLNSFSISGGHETLINTHK
jgi:adenylyltransferase/sulfurtransferase